MIVHHLLLSCEAVALCYEALHCDLHFIEHWQPLPARAHGLCKSELPHEATTQAADIATLQDPCWSISSDRAAKLDAKDTDSHLQEPVSLSHMQWQRRQYLLADKAAADLCQVGIFISDLVFEYVCLDPVSDLIVIHSRSESAKEIQRLVWEEVPKDAHVIVC